MSAATAASLALKPVDPTEPLSPPGSNSSAVLMEPGSSPQVEAAQQALEHTVTPGIFSENSTMSILIG